MFDPAALPAHVRDELATVGYWTCPPDLRDRVGRWEGLGEAEAVAAENELRLIGSVLAR